MHKRLAAKKVILDAFPNISPTFGASSDFFGAHTVAYRRPLFVSLKHVRACCVYFVSIGPTGPTSLGGAKLPLSKMHFLFFALKISFELKILILCRYSNIHACVRPRAHKCNFIFLLLF